MSEPGADPSAPATGAGRRVSLRELADAGSPSFLVLGFLARLPAAMLALGVLLFVVDQTSSFSRAGVAVAALSVGQAVGGPLIGRLADRRGHSSVGLAATLVQMLVLAFFVVSLSYRGPFGLSVVLVALVGLTTPQTGSLARSRWQEMSARRPDRDRFAAAALGYEGAVDALAFVLGPAVVGVVSLGSPSGALFLTLVIAVLAQAGFAIHGSAVRGHPRRPDPASRLSWPSLLPLLVAGAALGVLFGAGQAGVAARTAAWGEPGLAGPVFAAAGLSGAVMVLLLRRLTVVSLQLRGVLGGIGLAGSSVGLVLAGSVTTLALACLLVGLFVSMVLVSAYGVAERMAPDRRRAAVMTVIATALVAGTGVGGALGGSLVASAGASTALAVGVAAGLVAAVAGLGVRSPRP